MEYQYFSSATAPRRRGSLQLSGGDGSSPEGSQYTTGHLDASSGGDRYGGQWDCSETMETTFSKVQHNWPHSSNHIPYPSQDLGTPLSNFGSGVEMIPTTSLPKDARYGDMAEQTSMQYEEPSYEGLHLYGNGMEDVYPSPSSYFNTSSALGSDEMYFAVTERGFSRFGSPVQGSTPCASSNTSAGFMNRYALTVVAALSINPLISP